MLEIILFFFAPKKRLGKGHPFCNFLQQGTCSRYAQKQCNELEKIIEQKKGNALSLLLVWVILQMLSTTISFILKVNFVFPADLSMASVAKHESCLPILCFIVLFRAALDRSYIYPFHKYIYEVYASELTSK